MPAAVGEKTGTGGGDDAAAVILISFFTTRCSTNLLHARSDSLSLSQRKGRVWLPAASPCSPWRRDFGLFGKLGCAAFLHSPNLKAVSGEAREERSIRPFPRSHPPVGQNCLPPARTGKGRETPRPFENTRPSSPLTPVSTLLCPLFVASPLPPPHRQLRSLHPRRESSSWSAG